MHLHISIKTGIYRIVYANQEHTRVKRLVGPYIDEHVHTCDSVTCVRERIYVLERIYVCVSAYMCA